MATRFYLANGTVAPVTPAVDAGWEITSITRYLLVPRTAPSALFTLANIGAVTVPITTTQDIVARQWVSGPIPPQAITGTVSLVIRVQEGSTVENATLAVVVRVVSQDGGAVRGTLFSVYGTDTEFAASGSDATRIVNAQAVTALVTQPGDRIVVEVGAHVAAPSSAGTYLIRVGNSAATDFALTSGLTTDLNPWVEFSQDIWDSSKLKNNLGLRPHAFSPGLAR